MVASLQLAGEQETEGGCVMTFKRGDIVRAKCRLMFGSLVVPEGTQIRIQGVEIFAPDTDETVAYEGNAILPDGLHLCYPIWPDDVEEVTT